MDCVNHSGVPATAYCQSCGKALCDGCARKATAGQILCEPCWTAWQSYQQPFVAPHCGGPHPALAAFLGLFPGVGAMYNGQFVKGFIHVAIFAVLAGIADHYDAFGILVAAWIIYQSFEAYHTARALRDGQPPPDPLGLNEVGYWLNPGSRTRPSVQSGATPAQPVPDPADQGHAAAGYQPPYASPYQTPYRQAPPIPPPQPCCWSRGEPIGALVLIALGLLFLLDQLDIFNGRLFSYAWPVLLIVLGVWLIVRRITDSHGGSK
jgi:TM2 domain-containing membrane protein YozV